jgi:diguanylate cyclase (GGDEF)-like protein
VQWSAWLKPQNLAFAAVATVLFALTWLALDLTDRVATAGDSIEHSHLVLADLESLRTQAEEAGKARYADMMALEWQSLDRYRIQMNEDLRELQLVIAGAMAAGILLLIVFLWHRADSAARPAPRKGESPGSAAGPAAGQALLEGMGKLLQSSVDYAAAYQVVQRCAAGLFADCSGALYLAAEPGGGLEIKTSWGKAPSSSDGFAAADCWAICRGEAYLAGAASDIACGHMHQPAQAPSLCVPVMGQGAVLGILLLEDPVKSGVLGSMRAVAKNFANQIGLALANMKLQETVRNLSVRDPLTGLFNRRYMEESLNREIAAARRNSRSLGVAICDLNRFKRFNDTFGHDAGNYALREIAQLIMKHIRSSDIACRYGKDEIVLIFPEAPLEGVVMRANQLREAIFALNLQHFERQLEKISVSFGVSMFPRHGKTSAGLLQQAELALASAKEFGNNRVQVASAGNEQV